MSRRDVETVATLAAHLAETAEREGLHAPAWRAARCAKDALALQKLGWRWRRMEKKRDAETERAHNAEASRIGKLVRDLLKPYGLGRVFLGGHWTESCICIRDLPTNMPDRTGNGFYI